MAMRKFSVTLPFSRSTKGTHLYETKDEKSAIQAVYIKKLEGNPDSPFDGQPPTSITITVEESGS